MTSYFAASHATPPPPPAHGVAARDAQRAPMRALYLALADGGADGVARAAAADWLAAQLAVLPASLPAVLPSAGGAFAAWHGARQDDTDERYKQYVAARRAGAPRRLFSGRAHALHYLQGLAPARLADGAWLYGVLARWDQPALRGLITTYLEELGNGVPGKNHVLVYRQLIDAHGCAGWRALPEQHYFSGLAQLALAHHAERFLPELIGYNLGCEHAGLDTLMAAFELQELGIDPYYFSLHASADNSVSGHGRLALEALAQLTPAAEDAADAFLRRVDAGFRLHGAAPCSAQLLGGFDLREQLCAALARMPLAAAAHPTHPAHTLPLAGRALGEWLAEPGQVEALLTALEADGWVQRGADPASCRLWRLIEGDGEAPAPLAGLLSSYQLALLADWVGKDAAIPYDASVARPPHSPQPGSHENVRRGLIRHRFPDDEHGWEGIASELTLLEARVVASNSKQEAIALLTALMAPSNHHTATGLMATRMFSTLFAA